MSLLSDFKLAFETLADDPIDVGIYYGHSILQLTNRKLAPAPQFAYASAPASPSVPQIRTRAASRPVEKTYKKPLAQTVVSAPELAAPIVAQSPSREEPSSAPIRGDYARYISRSPVSRSTSSYLQRSMIGAL